jgi:hypothetical protein
VRRAILCLWQLTGAVLVWTLFLLTIAGVWGILLVRAILTGKWD